MTIVGPSLSLPLPLALPKPPREVAAQARTPGAKTPEARKIEKAARQFEAQLLTSVLTALENSIGGSEEPGSGEQYRTMATQGIASAWAAAGGIGIARMITHALSRKPQADLPPAGTLPLPTLPPAHY